MEHVIQLVVSGEQTGADAAEQACVALIAAAAKAYRPVLARIISASPSTPPCCP